MPPLSRSPHRARRVLLLLVALLLPALASAQVRERPVPFDSAGRVMTVTPPLAARLALTPPAWPVTGDFLEARLYAVGDPAESYVIVVRRQRDVVDRYPLSISAREALAGAIENGTAAMRTSGMADSVPTMISEPVRGQFVANQTALGALLFGPAASALVRDPAAAGAAYLLVTGGSFFYSAALTQSTPVTRAQNHLAAHSAFRGAIAADLAVYALAGDGVDDQAYAAATLAGGLAGDVIGFRLARPMTDAEAHGTSHGSTVAAALAAGTFGTLGMYDNGSAAGRAAAAGIIAAGALGYPLGLSYVRNAPYNVTAGDVGAMFTSEILGLGVAGSLIPDHPSDPVAFGMLTVGYGLGALVGDKVFVRPFDHTESDARLLALGTGAGALIGIALPALAQADAGRAYIAAATAGGILGALLTENLIAPQRASPLGGAAARRTGAAPRAPRLDVRWNPEAVVLAGTGVRGQHSLLSIGF